MRMWMIDPKYLCSKHLRGEHFECHMTVGGINKQTNIKLIKTLANQHMIDLSRLHARHDLLAEELVRRGGKHKSDLDLIKFDLLSDDFPISVIIDTNESYRELYSRCFDCQSLMVKLMPPPLLAAVTRDAQVYGERGPNGEYRKII